jgi:cob(I)alamin adenosyltransferase
MKIYTKTGDAGKTGVFAGDRVDKDDPRIEAYGTVDELNASLGLARSSSLPKDVDDVLEFVQHTLFAVGAELATPHPAQAGTLFVQPKHCEQLEQWIDAWEEQLEPLTQFILPAGCPATSAIHLARAICRRAERRVVTLKKSTPHPISDEIIIYLNRLGDLLFVASRYVNHANGNADVRWVRP